MAKRIYWNSMKKWALIAGIPTGIAGFTLLFLYLSTLGLIDVLNYSDDMVCAGTLEDPCLAFIDFIAKEDIFIYPIGYDPWGRATLFSIDEELESWKIYRSWGSGWREIKLNETCKGTWCGGSGNINVYSFVFRAGREYKIKIKAFKKDPAQTIKWGFGPIDPFWYGVGDVNFSSSVNTIIVELNSPINISANLSGFSGRVCVDIAHPDYSLRYACGNPNVEFLFNISWFRKTTLNDSSMIKNLSWNGGGNRTVYIKSHQYDELINFTINVSGILNNGTFPTAVKIYINNTLSNTLGLLFTGDIVLDETNNSNTIENLTYITSGTQIAALNIPKNALLSSAFMNLSGFLGNRINLQNITEDISRVNTNRPYQGQTFNASSSYYLDMVQYIGKINTTSTDCWLYDNLGGNILTNGNLTTSGTVPNQVSNCSFVTPYFLTEGIMYFFIANTGNNPDVHIGDPSFDSYPEGEIFHCKFKDSECFTFDNDLYLRLFGSHYPENVSLEVGAPDGDYEWEYDGEFNHTNNRTDDFTTALNSSLISCTSDSDGFCLIPLYFTQESERGIIQISDIDIDYTSNPNPVILSNSLVSSFLGNSTNFADIPIKFESTKNGTLQIEDIRFDYAGGNDTIDILVYDGGITGFSVLNFNNSLQIENLSFSKNENITRFLDLPLLVEVTSAFMNLSTFNFTLFSNLSIYYEMEDTSGDGVDFIVPQNNLTDFGSGITRGVDGLIGSGYNFSGEVGNSYINTSDFSKMNVTQFTVSLWVNWTEAETGEPNYIWGLFDNSAGAGYLWIAFNDDSLVDEVLFQMKSGGGTKWALSTTGDFLDTFPRNEWVHIVGTFNGTGPALYIDGTRIPQTYTSTADLTWSLRNLSNAGEIDMMNFGSHRQSGANNVPFGGRMDEFGFWNRTLSDSEITDLYNNGGGVQVVSTFINPSLEIGTPDGVYEWNFDGEFNQTNNRTEDLASAINTALNSGACDCIGCILTTNCSIPFQFHSDTAGTLQYNWQNIDYNFLGNRSNNETLSIINFYSDWDYIFPTFIDWLEFIPRFPTDKNVSAYGQADLRPIFNITNYGYGGKNSNFSVHLNESFSCVNLTISTTENKSDSFILNDTWTDLFTDISYQESNNLWMWADYSCNFITWKLWEPDLSFRNCCVGCFCSEEL